MTNGLDLTYYLSSHEDAEKPVYEALVSNGILPHCSGSAKAHGAKEQKFCVVVIR